MKIDINIKETLSKMEQSKIKVHILLMTLQKRVGGRLPKADINNEIKNFKILFLNVCKPTKNYEEIK